MEDNDVPCLSALEEGKEMFWTFNLPLQAWTKEDDEDGILVLNYMPRRQRCEFLDEKIPDSMRKEFFTRAAVELRALADKMESFANGDIDHVYYPR